MKKLYSLTLSILLVFSMLTACGGKQPNEEPKKTNTEVKQTNEELRFNLIKHSHFYDSFEGFQKLYPDVTVAMAMFESPLGSIAEGLKRRSTEEVMGQVDLLFFDATLLQNESTDIQKMMNDGWFADINEFIKDDSDFNLDDYNQTIMDLGVVDQKRYLLPLSYNIPLVLTTEKAMETSQFNPSKCTDYWGFAQEVEQCLKKKTDKSPRIFVNPEPTQLFYKYAGIDIWDFNDQTITLDPPELKKTVENYKLQYVPEVPPVFPWVYGVEHNAALFSFYGDESFETLLNDITILQQKQKKSVFFPLRTVNGKVRATIDVAVAINKNSPNKLNAYRLAKIMLSDQYQTKTIGKTMFGIPVLNSAIKSSYDTVFSKPREDKHFHEKTQFDGLSEQNFAQYLSYIDEITEVTSETGADSIFHKNMEPFYNGEQSYEVCIQNAQDELNHYMSK